MQKVHPTTGCCGDTYADLGYRGKFAEETNRILGVRPTLPDKHPNDKHPNEKHGAPRRYKDKPKRELRGITKKMDYWENVLLVQPLPKTIKGLRTKARKQHGQDLSCDDSAISSEMGNEMLINSRENRLFGHLLAATPCGLILSNCSLALCFPFSSFQDSKVF